LVRARDGDVGSHEEPAARVVLHRGHDIAVRLARSRAACRVSPPGLSLLLLAGLDVWHQRDADAWLLLLWTLGTFAFAGFINWSTNARSILPLVVPAGILIVRRIERTTAPCGVRWLHAGLVPVAAAAILSVAVTWAERRSTTGSPDCRRAISSSCHRRPRTFIR
jgi:hypothetical protein